MIDLILIIMLIVSLFKPDVFFNKMVKTYGTDEQKSTIAKNSRKLYGLMVFMFESIALMRYNSFFAILALVAVVLFIVFALPASKQIKVITKEIVAEQKMSKTVVNETLVAADGNQDDAENDIECETESFN